jgi:carboxyl-terminal processing protease
MKIYNQRFKCVATLLLLLAGNLARIWASPADLLEKAIYAEETKGDLAAASELYRQVVNQAGADRALAAQAQVRLGLCELKLGNKPQAITELEQLRTEFPDKARLLAILEQQMPSLLDEILKQIEQSYLQPVGRDELMETALRAIVGKIDANSKILRDEDMAFISARELADLNLNTQQKVAGIGIALKVDQANGDILATTVLPGSPALKGGVRAGDRIVEVDETRVPSNKLELAVRLLRGPIGTPVNMTVRREPGGNVEKLRLVRDNVRLPSVKGHHYKTDGSPEFMLDDEKKIGYMRITQFGQETPSETRAALKDLSARGMRALVLDLRNNPGGLLAEAVSVSDLFLESGRILTVKGRNDEQTYDAEKDEDYLGFRIALIVNRKTASAGEIIAAALQDNGRGGVIGERTFGQALVKSIVPLKDGIGALKLPVAAYFRPNGANMNRYPNMQETDIWGVKPNAGYEVRVTETELKAYEEYCLQRDVIGGPAPAEFEDRQLQRALEYLAAGKE